MGASANEPVCRIFRTKNLQWSFRIKRQGHVTLGPEEAYKSRQGVRRAVDSLRKQCLDGSNQFFASPLAGAFGLALIIEAEEWAASHAKSGQSKV